MSTKITGVSATVSEIARLAPSLSRLSFSICPAILLIAIDFFLVEYLVDQNIQVVL
jgi:hypothetical protein